MTVATGTTVGGPTRVADSRGTGRIAAEGLAAQLGVSIALSGIAMFAGVRGESSPIFRAAGTASGAVAMTLIAMGPLSAMVSARATREDRPGLNTSLKGAAIGGAMGAVVGALLAVRAIGSPDPRLVAGSLAAGMIAAGAAAGFIGANSGG